MQFKGRKFYRLMFGYINAEFGGNVRLGVFERAVAKTMANDVRILSPGWQGGGRPKMAGVFIANIERLAAGV